MTTAETCDRDCHQCGLVSEARGPLTGEPWTFDIPAADGVKPMPMIVPNKGTVLPQHSHPYDHITLVGRGMVEVSAEGEHLGLFNAPAAVVIKAGVKHKFQTLTDDVVLFCVHNVTRNGEVQFNNDHHLVKEA